MKGAGAGRGGRAGRHSGRGAWRSLRTGGEAGGPAGARRSRAGRQGGPGMGQWRLTAAHASPARTDRPSPRPAAPILRSPAHRSP
ncbi:hypothetical protein LC55x_1062 [Lysobacter capsici]|nr:hypothetical protein LC55x_1062 [Lysobacter capsici]